MEFTREAWENAPEGARLEYNYAPERGDEAHLIGYTTGENPVIEIKDSGLISEVTCSLLRIILPKRKVTVQLWRTRDGEVVSRVGVGFYANWTLLGEHTFEIEGE